MASELIAVQHTCKGLLKFILPDNAVTVDLEVMTLTEVHIYRKDRSSVEKRFFPQSEENMSPQEFLRKVREMQGQRTKEFLGSLLNQDLQPNFGPSLCVNAPTFPN